MDEQVRRNRRTGLLYSKKEIILSRSLGTEIGQKKSDGRISSASAALPKCTSSDYFDRDDTETGVNLTFLPYTDEEREQDDAILSRFDNALVEFTALKKRKAEKPNPEKENETAPAKLPKLKEIIELNSVSTVNNNNNNQNNNKRLQSISTASEIRLSKSSKASPARRRVKNTIPADNFERYLTFLKKKHPPMTQQDRILFWKFTPDCGDESDLGQSVSEKDSLKQSNKVILENNNDKLCSVDDDYKRAKIADIISQIDDRKSNEIAAPPIEMTSYSIVNRKVGSDRTCNSLDSKSQVDCEHDRLYGRVYGNARQIKERSAVRSYDEIAFKIPDGQNHTVRYLSNIIDSTQKEEFYKYLGLETTSPNGKTETAAKKKNNKRRSLRVRQMRIEKESKRVKEQDRLSPDLESDIRLSENPTPSTDLLEHTEDMQQPSSTKATKSRRTCGSIIAFRSKSPSATAEVKLNIVSRVDYTDLSQVNLQNSMNGTDLIEASYATPNKRKRLNPKNGITCQVFEKLAIVDASETYLSAAENSFKEIVDSQQDSEKESENEGIVAVGRKRQASQLSTPIPKIVSCVERVAYERPPLIADDLNAMFDALKNEDRVDDEKKIIADSHKCNLEKARNVENLIEQPENLNVLINPIIEDVAAEMTEVKEEEEPLLENGESTIDPLKDDTVKSEISEPPKPRSPFLRTNPLQSIAKLKSLRVKINRKSMKALRSTALNQRILRSKKGLKIMTKKSMIPTTKLMCNSIKSTKLKLTTDDKVTLPNQMDSNAIATKAVTQRESVISGHSVPSTKKPCVRFSSDQAPNIMPNPLTKTAGGVLHAFYEHEFLVIVQESKISFWKYSKVIRMVGMPQEWELLGEHERKLNDFEILAPFKNRLCLNELNPVYVEMRARQSPPDLERECNMASVYVNVYYYNEWKAAVMHHCVNLDTIKGLYKDVLYTTITNSRYFVMCWKQENILNIMRTGFCKYALTPDLDTLASIREFRSLRHVITQFECLGDDKLIGFGGTRISIWDHMTGDLLTNIDFVKPIGANLGSVFCSFEFQDLLLLYQKRENESTGQPQLQVLAVNLSEKPNSFQIVYSHDLPSSFSHIKSSLSTSDFLVVTATDESELLLLTQQPHRLFYFGDQSNPIDLERYYTTGSQYFVEFSPENLVVKTIHEFLLDFVN